MKDVEKKLTIIIKRKINMRRTRKEKRRTNKRKYRIKRSIGERKTSRSCKKRENFGEREVD